jgi:hypothetical protein
MAIETGQWTSLPGHCFLGRREMLEPEKTKCPLNFPLADFYVDRHNVDGK